MRQTPSSRARSTSALGARAERLVRWHYRLRGYRVLATNARAGGNELDVVLRRGQQLVVCEVKSKRGPAFGDPLEAVGRTKERRIRRAAEAWLATRPDLAVLNVSFEVAAVRGFLVRRVPLG